MAMFDPTKFIALDQSTYTGAGPEYHEMKGHCGDEGRPKRFVFQGVHIDA